MTRIVLGLRPLRSIALGALVGVLASVLAGCASNRKVVTYDAEELLTYLRKYGYKSHDQPWPVWQSRSGDVVYFWEPTQAEGPRTVWAVRQDRETPFPSEVPTLPECMDDEGRPVYAPTFPGMQAQWEYGMGGGYDQHAGYFFRSSDLFQRIRVGNAMKKDGYLFEFRTDPKKFYPNGIISAGDSVVLWQKRASLNNWMSQGLTNFWVFTPDSKVEGGWRKEERMLHAEEYRPALGKKLLCLFTSVLPSPQTTFLYDVETSTREDLEVVGDGYLLILKDDFLRRRLHPGK